MQQVQSRLACYRLCLFPSREHEFAILLGRNWRTSRSIESRESSKLTTQAQSMECKKDSQSCGTARSVKRTGHVSPCLIRALSFCTCAQRCTLLTTEFHRKFHAATRQRLDACRQCSAALRAALQWFQSPLHPHSPIQGQACRASVHQTATLHQAQSWQGGIEKTPDRRPARR